MVVPGGFTNEAPNIQIHDTSEWPQMLKSDAININSTIAIIIKPLLFLYVYFLRISFLKLVDIENII